MIVAIVIAILVWGLVFSMTSVKLTDGQLFKFYYDESIYSNGIDKIYGLMVDDDDDSRCIFSYDVLKVDCEAINRNFNVLLERLMVHEGDVLITDCIEPDENSAVTSVRAKTIIDSQNPYDVYDYDLLLKDAETYLAQFLKDGLNAETSDPADYNNLDGNKIEKQFRKRMKKDNRFRTEKQKEAGVLLEKARIEDLCHEVKKFRVLLSQGDEYFFMYAKYEQLLKEEPDIDDYYVQNKDAYEKRYGLRVDALKGGTNASEFFKLKSTHSAKDVVVLVFDFEKYQPHLQFEAISFINAIVDNCSNLYDGI